MSLRPPPLLVLLFIVSAMPFARAQQTLTYASGDTNASTITTTSPNSPSTLTIASGSATQSGTISGSGELIKTGAGTLVLTGANTFTGDIYIDGGTLSLGSAEALGSSGTIWFRQSVGNPIPRLQFSAANTTDYSSRFTTASNQRFAIDTNGQNVTFASDLGGSSLLYKYGGGTLKLTGNLSGLGTTVSVREGVLEIARSANMSISSDFSIQTGATLRKSGSGVLTLTSNITGDGTLDIAEGTLGNSTESISIGNSLSSTALTGTGTLSGDSVTLAGSISGFTGMISTSGLLTSNGTAGTFSGTINAVGGLTVRGSLTLSSASSVSATGGISVASESYPFSAGTLTVNNVINNTVSVASGATLKGSGTIGGLSSISSGGHLAPGNSPGTLTFTNGLTLAGGSYLDFELGTSSDLILVTGGTLTGPSSGKVIVNLTNSGGFAPATYTLFNFSGATLSNFDLTDFQLGTTIAGYDYVFSLTGTSLDLIATAIVIPEPSVYGCITGALALIGVWYRRRRGKE